MNFEDKNEKNNSCEQIENSTKYGEFIFSYFGWITIDEQKKRAEKMENMTDKNK